jgi:hypothetical protein
MAPFLLQLASQGVVVIANGILGANGTGTFANFGSYGRSSYKSLVSSLDWVDQNAGKGKWAHLDKTRIAAAGQSCGGGEAYGVVSDPRVKVIGIFNSGGMNGMGGSTAKPEAFTKPVSFSFWLICPRNKLIIWRRSSISSAVLQIWRTKTYGIYHDYSETNPLTA